MSSPMFLPLKAGSPHSPADECTYDEPEKKSVLHSDDRQPRLVLSEVNPSSGLSKQRNRNSEH
jgi:hypothetical protein